MVQKREELDSKWRSKTNTAVNCMYKKTEEWRSVQVDRRRWRLSGETRMTMPTSDSESTCIAQRLECPGLHPNIRVSNEKIRVLLLVDSL